MNACVWTVAKRGRQSDKTKTVEECCRSIGEYELTNAEFFQKVEIETVLSKVYSTKTSLIGHTLRHESVIKRELERMVEGKRKTVLSI